MIDVKNLCVDLGEFILSDFSLSIKDGEYFILLGPTGAGKTVLLESIAGLYPIKSGEIWLREKEVTGTQPEKRKIGIVLPGPCFISAFNSERQHYFRLKDA